MFLCCMFNIYMKTQNMHVFMYFFHLVPPFALRFIMVKGLLQTLNPISMVTGAYPLRDCPTARMTSEPGNTSRNLSSTSSELTAWLTWDGGEGQVTATTLNNSYTGFRGQEFSQLASSHLSPPSSANSTSAPPPLNVRLQPQF